MHIIIRVLMQSVFHVLNFIFHACRPNFTAVAPTTLKFEQACAVVSLNLAHFYKMV